MSCRQTGPAASQRGISLVETLMAAAILIIAATGLLPLFVFAIQTTNQQGDTATRTIEYAQDKMEQLLSLSRVNWNNGVNNSFNDGVTDTTVFPSVIDGSTGCDGVTVICGLGGTMAANSTVGSVPPAVAVKYFVDYLDVNGNLLTSSAGAYYVRQWSVSTNSTATLKTITVVATASGATGLKGAAPSTTLVCVKSSGL